MSNGIIYHVNKETGRAGLCRATKKGCPLFDFLYTNTNNVIIIAINKE